MCARCSCYKVHLHLVHHRTVWVSNEARRAFVSRKLLRGVSFCTHTISRETNLECCRRTVVDVVGAERSGAETSARKARGGNDMTTVVEASSSNASTLLHHPLPLVCAHGCVFPQNMLQLNKISSLCYPPCAFQSDVRDQMINSGCFGSYGG